MLQTSHFPIGKPGVWTPGFVENFRYTPELEVRARRTGPSGPTGRSMKIRDWKLRQRWDSGEFDYPKPGGAHSEASNAKRRATLRAKRQKPAYQEHHRASIQEHHSPAPKPPTALETRAKRSASMKARWQDPAYRAREAANPKRKARKGCTRSPESIAAGAAKHRALWQDPEYRAKQNANPKRKGRKHSPESRAKMSASMLERWQDPAMRARHRDAMIEHNAKRDMSVVPRSHQTGRFTTTPTPTPKQD